MYAAIFRFFPFSFSRFCTFKQFH
ncbi:MAG: hypothetical protein ACQEXB_08895 [Bacillota bacterium]